MWTCVSRLATAAFVLGAFSFTAFPAKAASDFTLGSSTLTVGVEGDSTADGGCMNGTTTSGCDSYSFKVPLTVDPNNDIADDLVISGDFLAVGISSAQFCNVGNPDFGVLIPHSALVLKRTKSEDKLMFTGMAEANTATETAMVPVKVLIQVQRHTGKGFFMASGLGDLTLLHGNSSAFVGLLTSFKGDGDGDTDFGCTSVTQKNKSEQ
jgi:hypothetical protein